MVKMSYFNQIESSVAHFSGAKIINLSTCHVSCLPSFAPSLLCYQHLGEICGLDRIVIFKLCISRLQDSTVVFQLFNIQST